VREAARAATGSGWTPINGRLKVQIVHYHERPDALDVDNMVKPINDAMKNGVVFIDDRLITDLYGARRRLSEAFQLEHASKELVAAIDAGQDFVHIVVTPAPDPREVLA